MGFSVAKVTIEDVAQKAGVSIKTVSRVMNKEPNVRQTTSEKVLLAIKELNYKPSASARSLAGNRSYLLGVVYDNPSAGYVIDIQTGVLRACTEEGFNLLIHPCDHLSDTISDELINLASNSRLDGLILTPPLSDMQEVVSNLLEKGVRVALIAPPRHGYDAPAVFSDGVKSSYEMTRYLISLGHTRIGFIVGHKEHGAAVQRLEGYRQAMEEAGVKVSEDLIEQGEFSFDSGEACARRLLSAPERPTAIFASNDYMAAGVMKVAQQMNIAVPHDLSVAGFDDAPVSRQLWPTLTTIKQPVQEMAHKVTTMLVSRIRNNGDDAEQEASLESRLIVRESTGPLRRS
jgi:LacI family transcriptional regulator